MNIVTLRRLSAVLVLLGAITVVHGQEAAAPAAGTADPAVSGRSAQADDAQATDRPESWEQYHRFSHHGRVKWRDLHDWGDHRDNHLVSIGHDSRLEAGQQAGSVVSILGSSTSEGDAGDVVSILGNTWANGPVQDSAVAVLGNTYVDSKIGGDVVAVIGNVELGPHAEIDGDVVAVLGTVRRDPAAIVHGSVQDIFAGDLGGMEWLHTWIKHCLLYGRPLALVPGLAWAWVLALGLLMFYAVLALLFRESVDRCVHTFETQPGRTLLAALIAILLTPVLVVLLCVTVIGIAALPFVVAALLCAGLFGKAVMLAWIGGRITRRPAAGVVGHPAFAVLVGGAVVLACYLMPVLGFLVYKLLGILGFGTVVYTLILAARAHQTAKRLDVNGTSTAFNASASSPSDPARASASAASSAAASMSNPASVDPVASTSEPTAPGNITSPAPPQYGAQPGAPPPGGDIPHGPPSGPPPRVIASMPRAGFWIRMAALFLDVILVCFAMSVLHDGFHHLHLLVLATYGAVMWKLRASTVGGIVFDLRVARLDGRPVDWQTAVVRALACFLSLAVAGLGFFWIAFDDAHQAWHDKIAGTVVVRVPKGVPLAGD